MGDIIAISQLAGKVYSAYKDAPNHYKHVAGEVRSLRIMISRATQHFKSATLCDKDRQEGEEALKGCRDVLEDLDSHIIQKYKGLALAHRRLVFKRVKLGTEDIATLRSRLTSSATLLSSFIRRFDTSTITISYMLINYLYFSCEYLEVQARLTIVLGPETSVRPLTDLPLMLAAAEAQDSEQSIPAVTETWDEPDIQCLMPAAAEEPGTQHRETAATEAWGTKHLVSTDKHTRDGNSAESIEVVHDNHNGIVQPLAENSTLVKARDTSNTDTPLHLAASGGHADIVELLLKEGIPVNAIGKDNNTPLHLAANNGHSDIVELLLRKGALIEPLTLSKHTPLHIAAIFNHRRTAELLLEKGASIGAMNGFNYTPLHMAAGLGNTDAVELLISRGAPINALNIQNSTPLHLATMENDNIDVVELLISGGASIDALNIHNKTPLHCAAEHGSTDAVKLLISKGAKLFVSKDNT